MTTPMGRVVLQQEFLPITDTPRPSSWVPLPQKPPKMQKEHPPAHPSQGPRVSSRAAPRDGPVSGGGLQSQVPRRPGPDDNVASCQDGPSRCGSPPCSAAAAQLCPVLRRRPRRPQVCQSRGEGVGPGQCSGGDVASQGADQGADPPAGALPPARPLRNRRLGSLRALPPPEV